MKIKLSDGSEIVISDAVVLQDEKWREHLRDLISSKWQQKRKIVGEWR